MMMMIIIIINSEIFNKLFFLEILFCKKLKNLFEIKILEIN
jgi:hypothetical protein